MPKSNPTSDIVCVPMGMAWSTCLVKKNNMPVLLRWVKDTKVEQCELGVGDLLLWFIRDGVGAGVCKNWQHLFALIV
jgi:hypothetical protein